MKVIGVGDNVIDRYLNKRVIFPGGNAVNFAAHVKKNGIDSAYLGVFGSDREGDIIRNSLTTLGVDVSMCETRGNTKFCDINLISGERVFLKTELGTNWNKIEKFSEEQLIYLSEFDLIHTSCNAKLEHEICKLQDFDSIITFDFSTKAKYRTDEFLEMTCPYLELALFSCDGMDENEIYEFERKIHNKGAKNVLVTRGEEGPIFYNGQDFVKGEVKYIKPVDTMGAGDSYLAALVAGLLLDGWKKGRFLEEENVLQSMSKAAKYSASNCLVEGGYGFKHAL